MDLSHGFRDEDANGGVAVQDRNVHLDLSDIAVKVARHQPLALSLEVVLVFRPVCSLIKMDQDFIAGC